ncbi:MAG: hypothetical protein RI890_854, partial [Actinomycetota bacterium]
EIMLPKVETAAQIVATDLLLRQVEIANGLPVGHIGIEAQIETARGLINVEEICAASPRLETIIFGPADFAASMEMPVLTGGVQIADFRSGRFRSEHGDASFDWWRADCRVSGRPLSLCVFKNLDGWSC